MIKKTMRIIFNNLNLEIILRPIRIEPRIEDIELDKNCFGSEGILELYKAMIFNKSIKFKL